MTADSISTADAHHSQGVRRRWVPWFLTWVGVLALLTLFLVVSFEARLDASTIGLVIAAAGLVFCLHTLYRVVQALSRPSLSLAIEREEDLGMTGRRGLHEERRRLLRAIRELEFDHQMGKLSQADYKEVRAGYELRAIEVMRALQETPNIEADLLAELRARGVSVGDAPGEETEAASIETAGEGPSNEGPANVPSDAAASDPEEGLRDAEPAEARAETRACAGCGGGNDGDARFCKHCGKELAA